MKTRRLFFLLVTLVAWSLPLVGCSGGDEGVDKPLVTNAPPPPPRPDKPSISPSGVSTAPATGTP